VTASLSLIWKANDALLESKRDCHRPQELTAEIDDVARDVQKETPRREDALVQRSTTVSTSRITDPPLRGTP
jgi:hypothetical protein